MLLSAAAGAVTSSMQQAVRRLLLQQHHWQGPGQQQLRALATTGCAAAATAAAAGATATSPNPPNAMALIKELRQQSGAPIADVKSCLAASNWDMGGAMEALRLKGLAAAVKKASRHASEGLVAVAQHGPHCVSVVEINSETDFVGRSEPFQQLVKAAARAALGLAPPSAAAAVQTLDAHQLSAAPVADGSSIAEGCASLAGKVRENIALRRGWAVSSGPNGVVSSYVHMPVTPGAGRIAAVVALQAAGVQELQQDAVQQLSELAGQLAMHSTGMQTQHVSSSSIPAAELAALRADFASQTEALMQGKPAAVLEKVVEGKLAKWLKEACLLDQRFVLDDSVTVQQLLKAKAAQLGLPGALEVAGLLRAQVGEGLARDEDKPDFAAEVAAMVGGSGSGH